MTLLISPPLLALANNKIAIPAFKNTKLFRIRRSCASQPTAEVITGAFNE